MATEIQFLRDQLLEKDFIIRSLFMSKSVKRDNDNFSRNIKNPVDNVNKNVTPSSPHKNINTDKNVNNSNIQSNNRLATPADMIMKKNLLKVPKFALTKMLLPHHLPYMADPKLTPHEFNK